MKRRHLILGLSGIYLSVLTAFMLYAGFFQLSEMISLIFETRMIGSNRLSYNAAIYWWVLFGFLVPVNQIVAGGIGIACVVIPSSWRWLKKLIVVLLIIQVSTIVRDIMSNGIEVSTFTYVHRIILVQFFAKYWQYYQEMCQDSQKEYFPFIHELVRYRKEK